MVTVVMVVVAMVMRLVLLVAMATVVLPLYSRRVDWGLELILCQNTDSNQSALRLFNVLKLNLICI